MATKPPTSVVFSPRGFGERYTSRNWIENWALKAVLRGFVPKLWRKTANHGGSERQFSCQSVTEGVLDIETTFLILYLVSFWHHWQDYNWECVCLLFICENTRWRTWKRQKNEEDQQSTRNSRIPVGDPEIKPEFLNSWVVTPDSQDRRGPGIVL